MSAFPAQLPPLASLKETLTQLGQWRALGVARRRWFSKEALTEAQLEEANDAVAGTLWFRFNGISKVKTGRRGVDWQAGQVAHQEWRAQLHRFSWLGVLARAFRETGRACYAEAAWDYVADWLEANPLDGNGEWKINVGATLDLAIRVGNTRFGGWLLAIEQFGGNGGFDSAFETKLFDHIRAQLRFLEKNLTILGNWRLCEGETLLYAGLLMPWAPEAARWRALGVEIINEGFLKQVLPDGAHYELTPGYHHWMNGLFYTYWSLHRTRPDLGLRLPTGKLAAMFDYGMAVFRPDQLYNGWNDCQSTLAVRDAAFFSVEAAFREEAGALRVAHSGFFPWAKQAALRDGDWYLTLDGAPGAGTHSHLGRNGLTLMAHGQPLLVDPGYLSYDAREALMAHGRSTRAHNTLNFNGWNQNLSPCTEVRHRRASRAELLVANYEGGYWSGAYDWRFAKGLGQGLAAQHHRITFWIKGLGVLVVDGVVRYQHELPEVAPPVLEANWQFATQELAVDRERQRVVTRQPGANLLMLLPTLDEGTALSVHCGEQEPSLRGWIITDNGLTPAAQLALTRRLQGRYAEWVTLLIPFAGEGDAPAFRARVWRPDPNFTTRIEIDHPDGTRDEVTWSHRFFQPLGRVDPFETDAPLLWTRRRNGATSVEVTHFGSTLEPLSGAVPLECEGVSWWERP